MRTGALTERAISDGGTRDRLRNDFVLLLHAYVDDEYADGETEVVAAVFNQFSWQQPL